MCAVFRFFPLFRFLSAIYSVFPFIALSTPFFPFLSLFPQPQRKSNFVHFSLKIWHVEASNLLLFLRLNWPQCVKSTAKFGGWTRFGGLCLRGPSVKPPPDNPSRLRQIMRAVSQLLSARKYDHISHSDDLAWSKLVIARRRDRLEQSPAAGVSTVADQRDVNAAVHFARRLRSRIHFHLVPVDCSTKQLVHGMRWALSSHKRLAGVSPLSQKTPGRQHYFSNAFPWLCKEEMRFLSTTPW